jgi:hypothetical protein
MIFQKLGTPARALTDPAAIGRDLLCRFNRSQAAGKTDQARALCPSSRQSLVCLPSGGLCRTQTPPPFPAAGFPTQIHPNIQFQQSHRLPSSTARAEHGNPRFDENPDDSQWRRTWRLSLFFQRDKINASG